MSYRGQSDRGRGGYRGGGGGGGDRGRGGGPYRGGGGGGGYGGGGAPFRGGGDRGGGFRGGGRGGGPAERGGIYNPGRVTIDARVADNSDKALVASRAQISVHPNDLPLRPDFGTAGREIKLRANFFPIRMPRGPLFEYDVAITPVAGTAARRVKKRIFELLEQSPQWTQYRLRNKVVHDSSAKLISISQLPQPLQIRVPFYDADETPLQPTDRGYKEYTLTITFTQPLDLAALQEYVSGNIQYRTYDIMPLLSAMNLLLAAQASATGVQVGRNRYFFPANDQSVPLGGGLEAFRGFYSSVRPSHKQLMVNLNVCTTAFYEAGNLAAKMSEFMNASFGARATAFAKGVRVRTTHLGYKKTVKRVSDKTARTHSFACAELNNAVVTVERYFAQRYNIQLQYPNMPLVDVGGAKQNLLPAEVCEILPGQAFKGKLTDDHTAAMIKVAAKPPNVNAATIAGRGLDALGFRQGAGALAEFGVSIGQEMAVVPGRLLPAPRVIYGQGTPSVDDRASWNLRDVKFKVGARLDNWAVLVIRDGNQRDEFTGANDPELLQTMKGFVQMCNKSGMQATPPTTFVEAALPRKDPTDPTRDQAVRKIRDVLGTLRSKPKLVFVILSNGDKHVYSGLKHLCDSYLDIATVCVHSAKLRKEKGQLQYFANVALKVNMKMGGVNHSLDAQNMAWLNKAPTMMVGIDVTHPGPGSVKGTPSIAAVVASVDQHYAQFPASMEIQESRKEMVTNLKNMMIQRLQRFQQVSKRLPERVLVYRDGVSEGQFATVIAEELPEIKAAFRACPVPNYNPKLTIVICGKRHHTRFYPTEQQDGAADGNPKAGTVVDRGVTAVYDFDFFLQAHGGLQGTTRPTHYYVVHDEMGFTADVLQGLTNAVSYLFARATKAVSLVSPAYYADLACERGRCYLHKLLQGISSSASTTTSNTAGEEQAMKEGIQAWHGGVGGAQLKDTMFYL
ncbi:Argonaute-like protein [Mycena kentingensis (nom. inval.)]|nr:Argonaute-like protein [Mycena kentingensis (nom. inval.)]